MPEIESNSMSIVGIESSLEYARQKHATIVSQLFVAVYEIEQFEVALRNAKRAPGDLRPLESAGDPNCVSHEWHGDPENEQMFCSKCGARFDSPVPALGYESLPQELVEELLRGPIDIDPEDLRNATEKAAEVLRSEFLSQDEVYSLLRGVCGDDARQNLNELGFPGSVRVAESSQDSNDTGFPFSFDEPRGEKRVVQGRAEEEHF